MTTDPSVVRSVAISAADLVAALEATESGEAVTVLRVTPPFSGRMRGRLHVVQGDADAETLHVPPAALVDQSAPSYPTPDETADDLREASDDEYSVERHREYHQRRVREWRERLPDHAVDAVCLPAVGHEITISLLGP